MPDAILENFLWHNLTGAHAAFAIGTPSILRYVTGFPPVVALKDPNNPDFSGFEAFCAPGEPLYARAWRGPTPPGWRIDGEFHVDLMVWHDGLPEPGAAAAVTRLQPEHIPQMVALAAATRPGPFGARSFEFGAYFGVFEGDRLVAMAGERFSGGPYREISAVCTDPDFRGRGLARLLTEVLIRHQIQGGFTPVLHVIQGNDAAVRLYQGMGFRPHTSYGMRIIART